MEASRWRQVPVVSTWPAGCWRRPCRPSGSDRHPCEVAKTDHHIEVCLCFGAGALVVDQSQHPFHLNDAGVAVFIFCCDDHLCNNCPASRLEFIRFVQLACQ